MDRNMITVMSGQVVDFYDNDFRELYANSDKLDLFKEFHLSKGALSEGQKGTLSKGQKGTLPRAAVPKRPLAATSRFQVNLGDATRGDIKVPAHKYHNPKYLLALGQIPGSTTPLQEFLNSMQPPDPTDGPENPMEELENLAPDPSQTEKKESKKLTKSKRSWFRKQKRDKTSETVMEENVPDDPSKHTLTAGETSEAQDAGRKKKRGFRSIFRKSK